MTKLIIFTDLHILPEGGRIIGIDPYERLAAGVRHAQRHHPDAARIIITGDLTHHGDADSYRRLKALLDACTLPVSLTIGNHDHRDTFASVFSATERDENGHVQSILDLPEARLVLLDTLGLPEHHHAGFLCPARLAWLDAALAGAGERPVLIFMHHPPHETGFRGMDEIRLVNGDDFYDTVVKHGNVRHIFAGHVHRTISGSHRGIPFSVFKSPAHQQPMPFVTEDTSASVDEPGAYGIVLMTEHGLLVHTDDFTLDPRGGDDRVG